MNTELPDEVELRAMVDAAWDLAVRLYGDPPNFLSPLPDADPEEITQFIDRVLRLCLAVPDDPSYPWWLAGVLRGIGRLREAAGAYLWVAYLNAVDARDGTSAVDDPLEWRFSALELAAEMLMAEGLTASAHDVERFARGV
jgi:hypothetical protein